MDRSCPRDAVAVQTGHAVALEGLHRAAHERVLKDLGDYKAELKTSKAELSQLQALNGDLMKLKDASKSAAVVRKHSSAIKNFQSLVESANESLQPLPAAVCEALYYRARGDDYYPERDDWDDVRRSIENGQVTLNSDEKSVCASDEDPKVRKAMSALDQLQKFLNRPPAQFLEWYEVEFDGARPNLELRPFWKEHF